MLDGSGIALGTYICKDSGANAETVFCEVIPQLPGVRICSIRAPNNAHLPKPGFEECGSGCPYHGSGLRLRLGAFTQLQWIRVDKNVFWRRLWGAQLAVCILEIARHSNSRFGKY